MCYNFQRKKLCSHLLVGGAMVAAGLGVFSCSDKYELGEEGKQPSNLSNIYGYLQEQGNFSNYMRLIEDLGQAEVLSRTGSKTMFVANDEAFAKFFASNSWGVKSYEELSLAQKKLLLNSSVIDNPYSTSMLSSAASTGNTGTPVKGEVCRRSSSLSLFDSVMVVASSDDGGVLPDNPLFDEVRANHDSIVLFTDASNAAPMLHFTGKFVTSNKLSNTDIDFIYNQQPGTFKSDDVYVNNARVINSNIFCKNGFIHEVDQVIMPLDNMAEIIRKNPNTKIYSSLIERFAAPKDSVALTRTYNQNKGTSFDSVFVKRYFSDRSAGSTQSNDVPFLTDKNGVPFDKGSASLKFDPGWNAYVPEIMNDREPMMEDVALMLVPSDAAMTEWWTNGGGQVIADYYSTLEATPNSVIDDLIRNNQFESFTASVPSKFNTVLNNNNRELGIKPEDVDSVILGCNGVVFVTNKVFAPDDYSSVLFPAVIDTTNFSIIKNTIDNLNYDKYLNSMVSTYIFLLPTNNGLLSYVDPVSYGQTKSNLWQFYLDRSKTSSRQLCADVYECVLNEDGTWGIDPENPDKKTTVTGGTDNAVLKDRIEDLLDNIIVIEGYQDGKKYYKTKGRTFVKIEKSGSDFLVSGSWQEERQQPLRSLGIYNMENGLALALDGPVMGTRKSVAATLRDVVINGDSVFSDFYNMVKVCAISTNNGKDGWQAGDQVLGNLFNLKSKGAIGAEDATSSKGKAIYLLNNFHYTVYAPTNDAMKLAYAAGLPTLEDLAEAEALDDSLGYSATSDTASYAGKILEVMLDFVKYHIQDNSIFIDKGFDSGEYESGKTELIKSTNVDEETGIVSWSGKYSPGRPYKLRVNVSESGLSVTDCRYGYDPTTHAYLGGNTANVVMKEGMYNLMAREYWYTSSGKITAPWNVSIENSSAVVIHGIDAPLIFADGTHYDSNGLLVPTQFIYTYKPLSSDK